MMILVLLVFARFICLCLLFSFCNKKKNKKIAKTTNRHNSHHDGPGTGTGTHLFNVMLYVWLLPSIRWNTLGKQKGKKHFAALFIFILLSFFYICTFLFLFGERKKFFRFDGAMSFDLAGVLHYNFARRPNWITSTEVFPHFCPSRCKRTLLTTLANIFIYLPHNVSKK